MSNKYEYLPQPPRAWSRVQPNCTYPNTDSSTNLVYVPLINQYVPPGEAEYITKLLYKGNILQYKANSYAMTKTQRYSRIANGYSANRTKVSATQSVTYSNPNTNGFQRVNYDVYPFPNQLVGKPNNISGPFQYNVPNPNGCPGTAVVDGGNLVCGTYTNQCTGQIIKKYTPGNFICAPASASNVPGSSVLCWNDKVQTFYPRENLFMSNSTSKWPQNYKLFVSAIIPPAPVLQILTTTPNSITLTWTIPANFCYPSTTFNVYVNGIFYEAKPWNITYTTISLNPATKYNFYVTSVLAKKESKPSNIVSYAT